MLTIERSKAEPESAIRTWGCDEELLVVSLLGLKNHNIDWQKTPHTGNTNH